MYRLRRKNYLPGRILSAILVMVSVMATVLAPQAIAQQSAQEQEGKKPELAPLRREFKGRLPIPIGEKLEYEIKYSRFPIYATVGLITFEYLGPVPAPLFTQASMGLEPAGRPDPAIEGLNVDYPLSPGDQLLRLRATAVSKGMLIAILGIGVKDRYETLVDARNFSARVNLKEINEGKKRMIESSIFDDRTAEVRYLNTDLNNPQNPGATKVLPREDGMMSLLSAFYFVRFQKFKEGQVIRFPVSSDQENYVFDIVVGKKEKIKTDCGKIRTVKLEPKLFGPGQLISRQGVMTMWVTDDNRHVPLRLVARTSQGTISAKLINYKHNCGIPDPEISEPSRDE